MNNRGTFYLHYEDKYTAEEWTEEFVNITAGFSMIEIALMV